MTHMPSPQERAFADLDRQLSHIDIDFESIWSAKVKRRPRFPQKFGPGVWASVAARVATWRDRARKRRQLAAMQTRDLQDICQTPAQAADEARKPFWRA